MNQEWEEYYDDYYRRHPDPDVQLDQLLDNIDQQDLYDKLAREEQERKEKAA